MLLTSVPCRIDRALLVYITDRGMGVRGGESPLKAFSLLTALPLKRQWLA